MSRFNFGLAHIKQEGAPAHPEDIYIHCGCARCEDRWQKQLKAYNDFYAKSLTRKELRVTSSIPTSTPRRTA